MHELAIADSIFRTVLAEIDKNGYARVSSVGLRIGLLTDVVPEALTFGFGAIARGTPLEHTSLEIERIPITGRCQSCGSENQIEPYLFVCPRCGSHDIDMIHGDELDIAYIEIDDENSA
jgi:hydrogenase nickel incorporation protein HypA/HybF